MPVIESRPSGASLTHRHIAVTAVALSAALLLAACGGASAEKTSTAGVSTAASSSNEGRITVNWFVGLGTGADGGQPAQEQTVVDAFNRSQNRITVKMNVVESKSAADALAVQVRSGNSPDIVGPVGIKGANQFDGKWLDLGPLVAQSKFDTSIYDDQQLKAQQDRTGAQVALPFGVYPSMIWYNKRLFDKARIAYPPATFGARYADGREWTMDKLRQVALKLTLDSAGHDATSPAFNPQKVVQWGFDPQYAETQPAYNGSLFGAGSFLADDGASAQIPLPWLAEWKWYYDLIWKDHAAPNNKQLASSLLDKGNAFESGRIAMSFTHTWYLCCMKDSKGKPRTFWDLAAIPSFNGKVTAKLHSDSFRIFKSSKHPAEAFEVLSYFLTTAAPDLLKIYNAMPANAALQDDYFRSLDEVWTQHPNWQVAKDALQYPDIPNHEGYMPNFVKSGARVEAMGTKLLSTPGLDVGAEAAKLQSDLQRLFAAAQ